MSSHLLDHPADLVVGVGDVGGEDLGLAGEHLLAVGVERVPLRQVVRPGGELGVLRDHAEPLLVGEDLVAHGVPAHVELALELVDPFLASAGAARGWRRERSRRRTACPARRRSAA